VTDRRVKAELHRGSQITAATRGRALDRVHTHAVVVVVVVVEYGLTPHQTHYRSYWGRFLRVR